MYVKELDVEVIYLYIIHTTSLKYMNMISLKK